VLVFSIAGSLLNSNSNSIFSYRPELSIVEQESIEELMNYLEDPSKLSNDERIDELDQRPIESEPVLNDSPIIGILTNPISVYEGYNTYIMAVYIKFVQQAGARVVPIDMNLSNEELCEMMDSINGLIFPGGHECLVNEDGTMTGYTQKGKVLLEKAKELNEQGTHFPVLGVWLGFQMIGVMEAPNKEVLLQGAFDSYNFATTIKFKIDPSESKLYKKLPKHLSRALEHTNVTYNAHHDGILADAFTNNPELHDYEILTLWKDQKGLEYVSTFEHKKYPIFAYQSHPEKAPFVFFKQRVIPHCTEAIELSQYYGNYFVNEAKKNAHTFSDYEKERSLMIENFSIKFTDGPMQDIYLIE
jgi:gamma-glutamyl hydrolase